LRIEEWCYSPLLELNKQLQRVSDTRIDLKNIQHQVAELLSTKPSKVQSFILNTSRSRFVRNVAVVATGTAGAQAIAIAFSPIITRLYGPEAFGLLGMFLAISAVVTPITALTYPIAIVLPKTSNEAKGIAQLSVYIALGFAAVLLLIILMAGDWVVSFLSLQGINSYLLLIPLYVFFSALLQISEQWLIRIKQFGIIARAAVLQVLMVNSLKTVIGLFKPVASVLIVLAILGSVINAGMLALGIKKASSHPNENESDSQTSLWKVAKKHYDFPLYRAPQDLLNAASQSLPTLMLAAFFGPISVGFYTLGVRMLSMPLQLIGKSVGDVFYPRINEAAHNRENLTKLTLKATLSLAAVGFVPFAVVIAFGPWLFGFVFGSEWVRAGAYARWLAVWMYFMFINNPSIKVLPIISAQGFHLVFTFFTIAIRFVVLAVGYYIFKSDLIAVGLFGISGAIINITLIIIILFLCSKFDKDNQVVYR